nr:Hypothetical protein PLANC_106 [Enterococcus phage Planchet]
MQMNLSVYEKLIKKDEVGKYFLIDSDRYKTWISGCSRLDAYRMLINTGFINENRAWVFGIENYVELVDRILDGSLEIGRFRFYRVSESTETLEEQLRIERRKCWEVKEK